MSRFMLRAIAVSQLVMSTSVIAGEPSNPKQCALLLSVDLAAGQMLTVKWTNTCSFPIMVEWSSELDGGGLVHGSLSAAPNEVMSAKCRRCAFPTWTEKWPRREAEHRETGVLGEASTPKTRWGSPH
jgi:hypothetical protein